MFIATNRISLPAAQHPRMIEAFERSAPTLKQFLGFMNMEIWSNEEEGILVAVSHWENKEAYEGYIHSDTFRQHHGGQTSEQASPHANITYYTGKKLI